LPGVLILGHRLTLEKNYIQLLFTPLWSPHQFFNWYKNGLGYLLSLTSFVTKGDMEKGAVKLIVFNGEDFSHWKNRIHNYLLSQGHAICEIIQEAFVVPMMLENATAAELTKYENNYKALNLITTALGRNAYDRISLLESAHAVWKKLCNTF
jgi:hypothetical protein